MISILLLLIGIPLSIFIIWCTLYAILKLIELFTFTPYTTPYEYSKEDLPEKKDTIKMIHYNCFWRPWLLHIGTIEYVRERMRLVSERLDEFDVICLNESFHFGSNVIKEFVERMQQRGFKYVVTAKRVPFFSMWVVDSGVMILSKYPIIETDSVPYTEADHWCWFAMKSCVYAKIQVSKTQHINVFSTHLQATSKRKSEIHIMQFQDIHNLMMRNISADTAPTFLLGDMNTGSNNEKDYNDMLNGVKMPNYKVVDTFQTIQGIPRTIDYILLFRSLENDQIKDFSIEFDDMKVPNSPIPILNGCLSDHPAIKGVFNLK